MRKVAFIAFSDVQIEDWKRYSENHSRFKAHEPILDKVLRLCIKYKCPALFCGDLFDNNQYLSNYVLSHVFTWFEEFRRNNIEIFAISGNHDQSESNDYNHRGPNYIKMMSSIYLNFHDLDFRTLYIGDYSISGIPFISGNRGYTDVVEKTREALKPGHYHILLTHTDMWGAVDTTGRPVDSVENIPKELKKFFKGFNLVLNGHIHKPQTLRSNIITLGATHQQRTSDIGNRLGIWKIYKNLTCRFVNVKSPKFVRVEKVPNVPNPNKLYIVESEPENVLNGEVQSLKQFRSSDPIKVAKAFLKANNIKSKKKLNLLIKYLNAGD